MNQNVNLDHLNLTVNNFAESVDWYNRVFGFELVERGVDDDGPWGILRSGDSMLCVYECPKRKQLEDGDSGGYHQILHFGLRISDRKAWEETLQKENIETRYGGPVRYPHSTSWYITDPTGYMIEVALWEPDGVRF